MNNRTRYTADEIQRNTYYQMPKFLFTEEFKGMSNDARVLYSLLRDRHELSIKNHWVNENNEVYLIFSRENMCEMLELSTKTVIKAINELKKYNLIDEHRRGQGKPNHIYLLTLETLDIIETCKFYKSRSENFTGQNVENFHPNKTYKIETKCIESKSKSKSCQTESKKTKTDMTNDMTNDFDIQQRKLSKQQKGLPQTAAPQSTGLQSPLNNNTSNSINNDYTMYRTIIQENINYNYFSDYREADIGLVDELINCMLDVILTKGETVKINGEDKNRNMVIGQYLNLNMMDIEHILDRYKNQRQKITHLHSYLKTMLYTVKQENGHYYTNAVRADGIVH